MAAWKSRQHSTDVIDSHYPENEYDGLYGRRNGVLINPLTYKLLVSKIYLI